MAKSIKDILADLRREDTETYQEKVASADTERDTMVGLIDGLKSRIQEDSSTDRLIKQASAAGTKFAEAAVAQFRDALNTEEFAEKVACKILEKLAVDTDDTTIHSYTEPTPEEDPQEAVEKDQMEAPPADAMAAQKKKEQLLAAQTITGVVADGTSEIGKLAAMAGIDPDVLDMLADALVSEE